MNFVGFISVQFLAFSSVWSYNKEDFSRGEKALFSSQSLEELCVYFIECMRLSFALSVIAASTLIACFGWGAAVFSINPENATFFEWLLFFGPSFLIVFGMSSMAFLLFRKFLYGSEAASHRIGTSLREGFLMTCFLFILLFLRKNEWLVWWDALLVLVPFLLIELFFLRRRGMREAEKEKAMNVMRGN